MNRNKNTVSSVNNEIKDLKSIGQVKDLIVAIYNCFCRKFNCVLLKAIKLYNF